MINLWARRAFVAALALSIMLAALAVRPVMAANIVVTTQADSLSVDGLCSLREAVINANEKGKIHTDCVGGTGIDEITFAPGVNTVLLGSALPAIKETLTISGASTVTINGGNIARVFQVNNKATLTLSRLIIMGGNSTANGGGVLNQGSLVVQNSLFDHNTAASGGAIYSSGASVDIQNTTFDSNTAQNAGGAVYLSSGTLTISNATFYNNQATGITGTGGGLLINNGSAIVTHVTLAGNGGAFQGGGLRRSGGTLILRNSILANNVPGDNCSGTITDGTGNLVWGDATCPGLQADPHLQPLANNGGLTWTMALGPGSAGVNLANSANCPVTDQRGLNRRNGFCDSGAFEAQPATISATSGTPQTAVHDYPFAQSLVATVYDYYLNPLGGVPVTFNSPAAGASAVLSGNNLISNASGEAAVTATANSINGTYTVTADIGLSNPANFSLSNIEVEVTSITRADANPTNKATVDFTVSFNTPVEGVDETDFTLTTSGEVTGASVSGVSGSGSVYTVHANTGLGDGTLRLDLIDDDSIVDTQYHYPLGGTGAGNGNYLAGQGYTIDKTAPETTILETPSNPTNSTNAQFTFTSEPSSSFECSLDGAESTPCSSPISYTNLLNGNHVFSVRATDLYGNTDPTPATFTWVVNTIGPAVTIDLKPFNPTRYTDFTFTFTVTPGGAGIASTACWVDSDSPTSCSAGNFDTQVTQGNHTFHVTALDLSGNPASASYAWVVDTTPPTAQITALPTFTSNPSLPVNWSGSDDLTGVASYDVQVQVDEGGWTDWLTSTSLTNQNYTGVDGKKYEFQVRSVDQAGNPSPWSQPATTTVDTTAPSVLMNPPHLLTGRIYQISWSGSDSTSGIVNYDVEIQEENGAWVSWQNDVTVTSDSFTATPAIHYHFRVRAVDQVGNVSAWSQPIEVYFMYKVFMPYMVRTP